MYRVRPGSRGLYEVLLKFWFDIHHCASTQVASMICDKWSIVCQKRGNENCCGQSHEIRYWWLQFKTFIQTKQKERKNWTCLLALPGSLGVPLYIDQWASLTSSGSVLKSCCKSQDSSVSQNAIYLSTNLPEIQFTVQLWNPCEPEAVWNTTIDAQKSFSFPTINSFLYFFFPSVFRLHCVTGAQENATTEAPDHHR